MRTGSFLSGELYICDVCGIYLKYKTRPRKTKSATRQLTNAVCAAWIEGEESFTYTNNPDLTDIHICLPCVRRIKELPLPEKKKPKPPEGRHLQLGEL